MIVVFGSLNVDLTVPVTHLPKPGETVLGPGYQMVPGGKGANQALAAARAGGKVAMVGKVGRDGFADVALSELRAGGVDITRVERDEHPTGCALDLRGFQRPEPDRAGDRRQRHRARAPGAGRMADAARPSC